uniref:Uncharacterized protein n=1 Tax=viral metagenome TaxID=1070528 RepID=A0A6C0F0K3_9ZZZZ
MDLQLFMFGLVAEVKRDAELATERTKQKEYQNATIFLLHNGAGPLVELSPYQVYFALNGQPEQHVFVAEVKPCSAVPKIAGEKCGKVRSGKRVPKTYPVKCSGLTGTATIINSSITCNTCSFVGYTILDRAIKSGSGIMEMPRHNRKF